MTDINEVIIVSNLEANEMESLETVETGNRKRKEAVLETSENSSKIVVETLGILRREAPSGKLSEETACEKGDELDVCSETFHESLKDSKHCQEVDENLVNEIKKSNEVKIDDLSKSLFDKIACLDCLSKTENAENVLGSCEDKGSVSNHMKKIMKLSETFTDSSQSSSSELQSSAAPFESSSSSQENNTNTSRIDFENAIESQKIWKEANDSLSTSTVEMKMDIELIEPPTDQVKKILAPTEIPVITIDDNTQLSASADEAVSSSIAENSFLAPGLVSQASSQQPETNNTQSEIKVETTELPLPPQPIILPVIPPAPRKRGRPRKQVLPNPSPLVESWGPNAQEFPSLTSQREERKRSARGEKRQSRKRKPQDGDAQDADENSSRKRKTSQTSPKKKRRSTYVPKKKLSSTKKKHSEIENIQNFEEETRMSASEGPTGFSSRSGPGGDESQGSSATADGPAKSNINKKGRMEVGTDGCKPVTVQQIVEYYWPPPSSLPHGEKPEGLMIQEQITEYLGVKSFKRKYPTIKRRPVDMEERNYLQENGYVSENMCDLGLTAVFAADIIEIMYNDFPQKFEEYRKYAREKKAKEQRALREKQAAERADMDPKKDAVESAQSWNSEFNKTRKFKVVHWNPNERFFTEGMPCPASERIVLLHAPNNSALCVENFWEMSLFSYECEISSHTLLTHLKQHLSPNIWMFLVGSLK